MILEMLAALALAAAPFSEAEPATSGTIGGGKIVDCAMADPQAPLPERPILFIGSSSIAHWDHMARDVGENAVRCGYSGDQTADMIDRAKPVVEHYRPRKIFYYAGDNDLDPGTSKEPKTPKTPVEITANFKSFVEKARSVPGMKNLPISFLSIKESPARWGIRDSVVAANLTVCRYADKDPNLDFIDVFDTLLAEDGSAPNCRLFDPGDGESPLHLSEEGYIKWGGIIRPWMGPGQRNVTFHGCAWLDDLSHSQLNGSLPYVCYPAWLSPILKYPPTPSK